MNERSKSFVRAATGVALAYGLGASAWAQDASWSGTPGSADFNSGANWSTGSVPTGIATFATSSTTSLTFSTFNSVGSLTFAAGAPAYSFIESNGLTLTGAGIVNGSSHAPSIVVSGTFASIVLTNSATLGDAIVTVGGRPGVLTRGNLLLFGTSSAGSATITVAPGGILSFEDASSGGTARLIATGRVFFSDGPSRTIGSIEGTGPVELGAGTLTVGGNNLSTEFSGWLFAVTGFPVNSPKYVVKVGTGTWTLSGEAGGMDTMTVASGGLRVNGSLDTPQLTVARGASLSGVGQIGFGEVTNAGVLAPGNGSVGTLTLHFANYTQAASGTFQVHVDPSGQSSRLTVDAGSASLDGTVAVIAANGTYQRQTTSTILSAANGVSGRFSGVTSNFAFLTPTLGYDANNVYLTLMQSNSAFASGARTPNQRAVGTALDRANASATGDFGTVLNTLSALDSSQGPRALDAIGGQAYSGFGTIGMQSARLFMDNLQGQVGSGRTQVARNGSTTAAAGSACDGRITLAEACEAVCDIADEARWSAWGGGLGAFGTVAGDAVSSGLTYTLGGFAAGLDRRFAPGLTAGFATGFTAASLYAQTVPGRGTANTLRFALYGEYAPGPAYLDAMAGYAHSDNRMSRPIVIPGLAFRTAQGQTTADQFFGQIEAGYRFDVLPAQGGYVTPFVRLQGSTATQAGFTESGADSLDLIVAAQTTNALRSVLGARIGAAIDAGWRDKLAVSFRLGWSHDYADLTHPVSAAFVGAPVFGFTSQGAIAPRDGVSLGFAASTAIGDATSVYLRYDGDLAGANTNHAFTGGLRFVW